MIPEVGKCRIGIVGLGYVGLPLAVEFGKHYETVGFDVKPDIKHVFPAAAIDGRS
jgi:UDP-N-acetyl-D-mannosaminuronate dehydrogenase